MDEIKNSLGNLTIDGESIEKLQKLGKLFSLLAEGSSDEVTEQAGNLLDAFDNFCNTESDETIQDEIEVWMDSLIKILEEDEK
jgi:hypothetical protein